MEGSGSKNESLKSDVLSEQEARNVGINIQDKTTHYLYRAIQEKSTPTHIKTGDLFTLGSLIPELPSRNEEEITETLKRLTHFGMILPVVLIDRDPAEKMLNFRPCYLAKKEEDTDSWHSLLIRLLERTVEILEIHLKSLEPVGREQLLSDLEFEATSSQEPSADRLNYYLIDIINPFRSSVFPFEVRDEWLESFRKDLISELQARKRLIPIRGFAPMPFNEEDFLLRFKTAAEFLKTNVFPRYNKSEDFRADWNRIGMQEASHNLEDFAPQTAVFELQRAELLDQTIRKTKHTDSVWYPGRLPIEIIRASDVHIKDILQKDQDKRIEEENSGFRTSLIESSDIISCLRFIPDEDFQRIHPKVRDSLLGDRRILHSIWETKKTRYHVFATTDLKVLRSMMIKASSTRLLDQWKLLAFRILLEFSTDRLPPMVADHELEKHYSQLELQAFKPYFPAFFQVLFSIGIHLFRDYACEKARVRVLREQDQLRKLNEEKLSRRLEERREEKRKQKENLETRMRYEQIKDTLSRFYYQEEIIPTVKDLQKNLPGMSLPILRELLMEGGFQLVRQDTQDVDNYIVLFPLDYDWRSNSVRLYKVLENIFLQEVLHDPSLVQNLGRARILQKHMEKASKKAPPASLNKPGATGKDPYQTLRNAIEKQND